MASVIGEFMENRMLDLKPETITQKANKMEGTMVNAFRFEFKPPDQYFSAERLLGAKPAIYKGIPIPIVLSATFMEAHGLHNKCYK